MIVAKVVRSSDPWAITVENQIRLATSGLAGVDVRDTTGDELELRWPGVIVIASVQRVDRESGNVTITVRLPDAIDGLMVPRTIEIAALVMSRPLGRPTGEDGLPRRLKGTAP